MSINNLNDLILYSLKNDFPNLDDKLNPCDSKLFLDSNIIQSHRNIIILFRNAFENFIDETNHNGYYFMTSFNFCYVESKLIGDWLNDYYLQKSKNDGIMERRNKEGTNCKTDDLLLKKKIFKPIIKCVNPNNYDNILDIIDESGMRDVSFNFQQKETLYSFGCGIVNPSFVSLFGMSYFIDNLENELKYINENMNDGGILIFDFIITDNHFTNFDKKINMIDKVKIYSIESMTTLLNNAGFNNINIIEEKLNKVFGLVIARKNV